MARLLRRLKHKAHCAVKIFAFAQQLGGAQNGDGVAIVAAGVHPSVVLGAIGQIAGGLLHTDAVHVRAQADDLLSVAHFQSAHHARLADASLHLNAHLPQLFRHEGGGVHLFKSGFRMGM